MEKEIANVFLSLALLLVLIVISKFVNNLKSQMWLLIIAKIPCCNRVIGGMGKRNVILMKGFIVYFNRSH